ncbi:MAG: hypothetical protein ABIL09_16655 [Gemmatimonadota bacterium]
MSYRARVEGVSEDLDRPFWIRASWPAIGGEHPDLIRPYPGPVVVMPQVGQFVEVERIPGSRDGWWWWGPAWEPGDLPADVQDLYPGVAALLVQGGAVVAVGTDGRVFVRGAGQVVVDGATVLAGDGATKGVARTTDAVSVTDAALIAWIAAVGGAVGIPGPAGPYAGTITGGSATVRAKD